MKRKVKKFGRGGDILTGIGAALVGKHLYDKYVGGKDDTQKNLDTISEEPSYRKEKLISDEVNKAQKGADRPAKTEDDKKRDIFKEHASYFGGNVGDKPGSGGNVGTRTNTESPNSAASRDSNQLRSNIFADYTPQVRVQTAPYTGPDAKGVNEKDLDRLQRRNVPSGGKKSAPAKKSSADDVIAAGQRYARIGERNKPTPNMGKDNDARPSKPYPDKTPKAETLPAKPDKTPKAEPVKEKKYGIGPYGAFSSVHKAISGDKEKEDAKKGTRTYRDLSGKIQTYAKGGSVSSASKRADGIAQRGKTRGKVY